MKVMHLMGTLNRGGAETLMLDVCNNAAHSGLDMQLIHRKNGLLEEAFRGSAVPMSQLCPRYPFDARYLARLHNKVKMEKVDILHAHQVLDALYALLAAAGTPAKVVLSLHGHGIRDNALSKLMRRLALKRSDRVLFVSQEQNQHYEERYGPIPNAMVMHNGLDFNKEQTKYGDSLRQTLGMDPEQLLIGAVGNFSAGRDQLTTCRFLSLLQKEGIPFHFVFIGAASRAEPELYQQCFDYCQTHDLVGRVSFLGSRCDVPALLPQLDAFVYSTLHDTFGIALVEAISAGIPVFVNDWKVMREVTNEGAWATLYASKNENDLLEKFLDFYHHQQQYREKARQSAAQVKERYGIEKHLKNLKSIYASLLDG